jgi:predicted nucleotidyltransferase
VHSKRIYTLDEIKERVRSVVTKYRIDAVYLFGSYSRGEATPDSDIDIRIVVPDGAFNGIPWGFLHFFREMKEAMDKEVDIIAEPIKDLDITFQNELLRDEVLIYRREE